MTLDQVYSNLRYYIIELQYYIDTMEAQLRTTMILAIVAIAIALAAILFLSYMFFLVKKQSNELKTVNAELKEIKALLLNKNTSETPEADKEEANE